MTPSSISVCRLAGVFRVAPGRDARAGRPRARSVAGRRRRRPTGAPVAPHDRRVLRTRPHRQQPGARAVDPGAAVVARAARNRAVNAARASRGRRALHHTAVHAKHRLDALVHVGPGGRPVGDRNAHRREALPRRAAGPAGPVRLYARDDRARRRIVVAEAHQHLVQHDVVEDPHARGTAEALREVPRMRAAAIDEVGDAFAAQRSQGRVYRDAAGAPGELRHPVDGVALGAARLHQIGGRHRHGRAMRLRVAHDRDAAVVGHVEPLVRIRRPRIRKLDAVGDAAHVAARACPKAERAVDVQPRTALARHVGDRAQRIERTRVHVARLCAYDHRAVEHVHRLAQAVHPHAALLVRRHAHERSRAEPEIAQRDVDGDVRFRRCDYVDARRADETVALHVPADALQHAVPRGGEAGEVRHLATRDETHPTPAWQVEHFEQPARGDLLERGRHRRDHVDTRVLVPRGHQPIGGEGDRNRAADDEAEITRRRAGLRAARRVQGEPVDHRVGGFAARGQGAIERGEHVVATGARTDEAFGQRVDEPHRMRLRAAEQRAEVVERHGMPRALAGPLGPWRLCDRAGRRRHSRTAAIRSP